MDDLRQRIIYRFVVRATIDAKLNAILLKIRKGTTGFLNWKQLSDVFAALESGWKLEKTVQLLQTFGTSGRPDAAALFSGDSEARATARHKEMEAALVSSLPTTPKAGKLYVKDLSPIEADPGLADWTFTCRPWMGAECWRVVAPNGETFDARPRPWDLGDLQHGFKPNSRSKMPLEDTIKWLNAKTDWLDQINRKLGMEAHEPEAPRTRDGTGTCPVCFQNVKARPDIVLHGYKRPGTGQVYGNCFGQGYPPFEISVKGVKDYLDQVLQTTLKTAETLLKHLKSDKADVLMTPSNREVHKGDPDWDRTLKAAIDNTEDRVATTNALVDAYGRLVKHWKERPLPREGERKVDWYVEGQKP